MPGPRDARIVRPGQWRDMPWKNGRGVTHEIARGEEPGGDEFNWRISVASVEADGPFSQFPGFDRTIMLLEGRGFRLDYGTHGGALIERPFEPHRFAGDWETTCRLLHGPVSDLNVITRRAAICHALDVLTIDPARDSRLPQSDTLVVLALSGVLLIEHNFECLVLRERDALVTRASRTAGPLVLRGRDGRCVTGVVALRAC